MTEGKRRKKKLSPPRPLEWARARQIHYIFDELIHNDDRNLGNSLIDSDWHVWLIDHTRAFHPYAQLYAEDRLTHINVGLWHTLHTTAPEYVRSRLQDSLTKRQIDALLGRWQLLLEHYRTQIDLLGEKRVLFSL